MALSFLIGICALNCCQQLPPLAYGLSAIGIVLLLYVPLSHRLRQASSHERLSGKSSTALSSDRAQGFITQAKSEFKFIQQLLIAKQRISERLINSSNLYLKILLSLIAGWCWALLHASWQLSEMLPSALEGQLLLVKGIITSIPENHQNAKNFLFSINEICTAGRCWHQHLNSKLSWYGKQVPLLHVGENWQLSVKLKRPHSILNPGGHDYERWLFEHRINAQGYVSPSNKNIRTASVPALRFITQSLRERINLQIQQSLVNKEGIGLITALVVGIRDQITSSQWSTMQSTGTNHLMAIAGLHIGFVATFSYFAASWLWRRSARLVLIMPAPQIGALMALLAAISYSALAGFALPTQRAIIMLSVFMLTTLLLKNLARWHAWSVALLAILIYDPLATLSDSFWLSFGSVAIILYGCSYRLRPSGFWWKYCQVQWVIAVGLIPLTIWFFQMFSLSSFVANAIAIPWVGFIILPLCLTGACASFIAPQIAALCWQLAEKLLIAMWHILDWLASLDFLQWKLFIPSLGYLIIITFGFLLLIAPRGFPARWLGAMWLLPVIKGSQVTPAENELWLTALDVGQGLAIVIQTAQHTIIYDTGPKYSPDFDMGNTAVVPYLRRNGIAKIDALIVSHADTDHSGGAESISRAFPIDYLYTSFALPLTAKTKALCHAGVGWRWDNAVFEFLNSNNLFKSKNDNSCVMKITFGRHSILLPGDIEKRGENYLVNYQASKLPATLIIAPHHGSKSSSTPAFVNAVHAQYVLFSVGYRNRFHFPREEIVNRYQALGAKSYCSDQSGAVLFRFKGNNSDVIVEEYRKMARHFWNL